MKRSKRPPFDGFKAVKVVGRDRHLVEIHTRPQALSKGLRKHLRKVWTQKNGPAEVARQFDMMGIPSDEATIRKELGFA